MLGWSWCRNDFTEPLRLKSPLYLPQSHFPAIMLLSMIFLFAEMFSWTCTYLKLSVTSALCTLSQFIVPRIMSLLHNLIYQFAIFCTTQPPRRKLSAWLHTNQTFSAQLWLLRISNCLRLVTTEVTECLKDYLYSSANFKCFAVLLSMQNMTGTW